MKLEERNCDGKEELDLTGEFAGEGRHSDGVIEKFREESDAEG